MAELPTSNQEVEAIRGCFRDFISRCSSAIATNRDSGQVWVRREDLETMREVSERLFFATLPKASPEMIAEARRQGKLPPDETPDEPEHIELLTIALAEWPDPDFEPNEDREIKMRRIRNRIYAYLAKHSAQKTGCFVCPTCKTELAFEGDVCGLCHPEVQP